MSTCVLMCLRHCVLSARPVSDNSCSSLCSSQEDLKATGWEWIRVRGYRNGCGSVYPLILEMLWRCSVCTGTLKLMSTSSAGTKPGWGSAWAVHLSNDGKNRLFLPYGSVHLEKPSGSSRNQVNSGGSWLLLTEIRVWGGPWGSQAAAAEISTGKVGRDGARRGNEPSSAQEKAEKEKGNGSFR